MTGTPGADGSRRPPALTFSRILMRSLMHRRTRSLSALVALTISAAVATALLTLYDSLDAKLHHEFRSFGANIVITESSSGRLPSDAVDRARRAAGGDAIAVPFGYAVAATDGGTPVVVAGTDLGALERLNTTWQIDPTSASSTSGKPELENTDPPTALVGTRAAQFLSDKTLVRLTFRSKPLTLTPAGHLRTGAEEDSRIYIPLASFTAWTGQPATVLEVQVAGGEVEVNRALSALRAAFPEADVQPIRQLVEGESRIVDRTRALMYASVLLIALTVALSVLATLSASILERRRDFALMKALGGSQLHLLGLFLVEALALGAVGVVTGWLLGSAAAEVISELNFHTSTLPRPGVLPFVVLLNLAIAAAAALIPSRVLRSLQPAALLKGD